MECVSEALSSGSPPEFVILLFDIFHSPNTNERLPDVGFLVCDTSASHVAQEFTVEWEEQDKSSPADIVAGMDKHTPLTRKKERPTAEPGSSGGQRHVGGSVLIMDAHRLEDHLPDDHLPVGVSPARPLAVSGGVEEDDSGLPRSRPPQAGAGGAVLESTPHSTGSSVVPSSIPMDQMDGEAGDGGLSGEGAEEGHGGREAALPCYQAFNPVQSQRSSSSCSQMESRYHK